MSSIELIKQAITTKGKAKLCFSGKSMYPTLRDSMTVTISNISSPSAIKTSDIIAYQQNNTITAHRVIGVIHDNGEIAFITKGDNQPFGGISKIGSKDLIGRVESAFYKDRSEKNILNKNICYRQLYVGLGKAYLFYRKFIRRHLPEFLRIFLKELIGGLYFIFRKLSYPIGNL